MLKNVLEFGQIVVNIDIGMLAFVLYVKIILGIVKRRMFQRNIMHLETFAGRRILILNLPMI